MTCKYCGDEIIDGYTLGDGEHICDELECQEKALEEYAGADRYIA